MIFSSRLPGGKSMYFRDPAGNSVELFTPGIWGLPRGEHVKPPYVSMATPSTVWSWHRTRLDLQ